MSQTTIIYPAGQMPSGVICGPTTGCGKMIPFRRVDGLQFMVCGEDNAAPLDVWETPEICPHCRQWCGKQTAAALRVTPITGEGEDEERLREIKARVDMATPGPWEYYRDTGSYVYSRGAPTKIANLRDPWCANHNAIADADFITHVRADVPWMLDRLTAQSEELTRLRRRVELAERARDRYVPCPDHRDKVQADDCQVCRAERSESQLGQMGEREQQWIALIARMPEPTTTEVIATGLGGDTALRAVTAFINRFADWRREAETFAAAAKRRLERAGA